MEISTNDVLRDLEEEDIDDLEYYLDIVEGDNGSTD